ncbi:MAG: TonB-dependent receptor [Bacteroidales bacterium]|nr:TonB-dependent receptor [Bacteroidales bacterium]
MKSIIQILMLSIVILIPVHLCGQGTTTSGINGRVIDENGEELPGANIVAVHLPSGSQFAGISDVNGYFRLPNMNVGGPYEVSISFVGFESFKKNDIYLSLGQTLSINESLKATTTAIEEVQVVGYKVKQYSIIDGNRTGAETVVNVDQINSLPTVNRDFTDFIRLTPQASVGDEGFISVAGINNRYNAISIDGALNNDTYGLAASGTNGGQTGASPYSMDVIEQFQVTLAPYDVRQSGFAGASLNAVTKSGTNQVKGTAYYLFRNENMAGKTPTDDTEAERKKLAPFTRYTAGGSFGGPIIKNKLFYFFNVERMLEETPLPFNFSEYSGDSDQAALNALVNTLKSEYDYDPGVYTDKTKSLESTKLFGRIDWNINQIHKLMLRHSYTKSILTDASSSSSRSLGFSNNYMYFPSTTNTTSLELKSNWENFSNSLLVSSTFVRDDRDPLGTDFPAVQIRDGNGTIYFGSEPYSTANELNQNILTFTDNFQLYKGSHTLTFGMNHEFASAYNLFIRKNYGEFRFRNMDDFMNSGLAYQYERGYSLVDNITGDGSAAAADFNMVQLGFYAQDEWQINANFKVTYGIRGDIPLFVTDPMVDDHFNNVTVPLIEAAGWDLKGAEAGKMPGAKLMLSPRVGFNWDVKGKQYTQIRGGVGIFTSRLPLVWPGASYNNNGVAIGGVYQQRPYWSGVDPDIPFNSDWQNQYDNGYFGLTENAYGGQVDLFTEDFKFPQIFRANFGIDQKLLLGLIGTLEVMYTKTINNMNYFNVNVDPDPLYNLTGADNRPYYSNTRLDNSYTRVMLGTNTSDGYTYNITAQLQKPFEKGLLASIAYTFGRSMVLNDATSSQNSSQWLYMENVNGLNNLDVSYSDFDLGHRVTGYITYSKEFISHLKSSFTLFYNGQTGNRYSYTYNGYLNGNNEYNAADLIYIPANSGEIVFADAATAGQQWAALDEFIENDEYLKEHRGEYAERNGATAPWSNIFDFKFSQDIFVNVADRRQTLQLTVDIFNLGNFLKKDWGRRYYVPYGNYQLISFEGFDTDGTTPTFEFNDSGNDPWTIDDSGVNSSRWYMQLGIRYMF